MILAVYYVVRAILFGVFIKQTDFDTNVVALIAFSIISLVFAIFLFLLYKKTKHVDLNEQ